MQVEPGAVVRRVSEFDVVGQGPVADLVAEVRTEVVEDEVEPRPGRVERADVAAEGEELDSGLALLDVPVEAVAADVVGPRACDRTPCGRLSGRANTARLLRAAPMPCRRAGAGCSAARTRPGRSPSPCPALRARRARGCGSSWARSSGRSSVSKSPYGLKRDALLAQQSAQALVGDVRDHPLGDQVVGELGQAPRRERPAEIGRDRHRDPLDLPPLGSVNVGGRPPA